MKEITDQSILFDLEYRGIDELCSKLNSGIEVPECFVNRVSAIIKKYYGVILGAKDSNKIQSGHFCLMPYENERKMILSKIGVDY